MKEKYKTTRRQAMKEIAKKGGEYYAEYDEETEMWGVFHTATDFCFSTSLGQRESEEEADRLNKKGK